MSSKRKLTWLGLWRIEHIDPDDNSELVDSLPMPMELLPNKWDPVLKSRVIKYLREAPVFQQYLGDDCDDLGMSPPPPKDYTSRTDGRWAWPGNLWYFVERLDLPLPQEFLSDMTARGFSPPANLDDLGLIGVGFDQDLQFWPGWARSHLRK